jgi:hypothetical protein
MFVNIFVKQISAFFQDPNFCRDSWWANLLYINNFVKQNSGVFNKLKFILIYIFLHSQCMGWTWYLANDFQLYAFAPILIIALHK